MEDGRLYSEWLEENKEEIRKHADHGVNPDYNPYPNGQNYEHPKAAAPQKESND